MLIGQEKSDISRYVFKFQIWISNITKIVSYFRLHQITKTLMRSSRTSIQGKILEKYSNQTYNENYFNGIMNVIIGPLKSKTFQLIKNISNQSKMYDQQFLVEYDKINDFSDFPLNINSGFFVVKNSTAIYSLHKIISSALELEWEIITSDSFSNSFR